MIQVCVVVFEGKVVDVVKVDVKILHDLLIVCEFLLQLVFLELGSQLEFFKEWSNTLDGSHFLASLLEVAPRLWKLLVIVNIC